MFEARTLAAFMECATHRIHATCIFKRRLTYWKMVILVKPEIYNEPNSSAHEEDVGI